MNFEEFLTFDGLRRRREAFRRGLPLVLQGAQEVYGGYIGEKLSKDSTEAVWAGLRQMGVSQIIDLRYGYECEAFRARCEELGIKYLSYPLHNDPETIANMVERFYDFSDMMMEGHFYMMGRTSSYVALCVYWAFGSNAGLHPMEFRLRITRNAHVMKKALPILNAIAKYKLEHLDDMTSGKEYADSLQEQIRDFRENPYPRKVWYSIFSFTRGTRNGAVVYDVSAEGLGVVGYLYPSTHESGGWEYDILLRPYGSGHEGSFADAQLDIVTRLCELIPHSEKYPSLPQSTKMALGILQKTLC